MRAFESALMAMVLVGCGGSAAVAQTSRTHIAASGGGDAAQGGWIDGAPVHTTVRVGDDGETFVGVWIEAPDVAPQATERAPMAVSLVVDTSGSMSGAKIENARHAAQSLIENLREGDIVSIYGFDNEVTEVAPPTRVTGGARGSLIERVGMIEAGGGTNMYDGLEVATARLARAPGTHPIRRLVLISDGHANVGPSDPASLGNLAAHGSEWGTQVTAIGVGLDYDETTLGELAVRSSGRLYHLEHPFQMATILEEELELLASTIATDAYIEIVPAPGVVILGGETLGSELRSGKLHVPLGNVHAGQKREVLFRARVATASVGERRLATAKLHFRPAGEGKRAPTVQSRPIAYHVTRDVRAAQTSVVPRVEAMVVSHRAAQAELRAAERLNDGDSAAAVAALDNAERDLRDHALSAPAPERLRLTERADSIRKSRGRAARARTPSETRGAALEAYDSAYEASGY